MFDFQSMAPIHFSLNPQPIHQGLILLNVHKKLFLSHFMFSLCLSSPAFLSQPITRQFSPKKYLREWFFHYRKKPEIRMQKNKYHIMSMI